jgi:hypothetical protein
MRVAKLEVTLLGEGRERHDVKTKQKQLDRMHPDTARKQSNANNSQRAETW